MEKKDFCVVVAIRFQKCLGGGGKYLEIAQHEVPCDFLESVADCTLLISEH